MAQTHFFDIKSSTTFHSDKKLKQGCKKIKRNRKKGVRKSKRLFH